MAPEVSVDVSTNVEERKALHDWLREFGTHGAIKARLERLTPASYRGVKTKGMLTTYEEPITSEEIQEEHGGGKYRMQVQRMGASGRYGYVGGRTFDIAGPPKIDGLEGKEEEEEGDAPGLPQTDPLGQQAMSMAAQLTRESRDEVARLREMMTHQQADPAILTLITGLQDNISQLQQVASDKDDQLLKILNQPQDTRQVDQLVQMMRDANQDHATRIAELRSAHDTELRQLRQFHQNELSQQESRLERQYDQLIVGHNREVDTMRQTHQVALDGQKSAYEQRIESLRDAAARSDRELTEVRTELASLRARKEQGPLDQINQIVAIKSGLETLMPAPEAPGDETSTIERVVGKVFESPVAQALTRRWSGDDQQGGERMVQVRRSDGQVMRLPASYVEQQRRAHAAAQAAQQEAAGPTLDKGDVAMATQYLEQAYRNRTAPQQVAASVRNLIPGAIVDHIREHGSDAFLDDVAEIDSASVLSTLLGRQYVRQIAEILLATTPTGAGAAATQAQSPPPQQADAPPPSPNAAEPSAPENGTGTFDAADDSFTDFIPDEMG